MTDARSGGLHSAVFAGHGAVRASAAPASPDAALVRAAQAAARAGRRHGAGARHPARDSARPRWSAFGGYPVVAPVLARAPDAPSPAGDPARTERGARPRQPLPRAPCRRAGAELRRRPSECRQASRRCSPAIRCARRSRRWPTRRYAPPTATHPPAGARRLARRARVQRRGAGGAGALPRRLRARLAVVQQCRAEDLDARARRLCGGRHRSRARRVLPRCRRAPGGARIW